MTSKPSQTMDELDDLLEQSKQLISTTVLPSKPSAVLTHVPKNLQSIYQQSRKLNQKVARTVTEPNKAQKGDLLLASRNFDTEQYRRTLNTLDLKTAFEPLEPLGETDIEAYLKHQHHMIMLTAIEEAKKSTSNQFYKSYEAYLDNDWRVAKKELQQLLNLHRNALNADYELSTTDKHPISKYRPAPFSTSGVDQMPFTPGKRGRTKMDNRMIEYSTVVYKLNLARKKGDYFPLITSFIEYAELIAERESRKREVINCWKTLHYMVNEQLSMQKGVLTPVNQEGMIEGAKAALAAQYAEVVTEVVANHKPAIFEEMKQRNPSISKNLLLVQRYVDITLANDEQLRSRIEYINNTPVWSIIYYCVRCGFITEAMQLAEQYQIVKDTLLYLLLRQLQKNQLDSFVVNQEDIAREYREKSKQDIYMKALYLLLGKVDLKNSFTAVFQKTEDWIWYKLHLVQRNSNYTLGHLQEKITQLGPQYFSPKNESLKYFRLLLLTQQFEKAIEYLCGRNIDGFEVEAVHFAIALYYYDQLNVTKDVSSPLFAVENNRPTLNFIFLIQDYVKMFAHTDPRDAVSYYYILDIHHHEACLQCMTDVVVESQDISTLLGNFATDGTRRKGCIEDFLSNEDILKILEKAATVYQSTGRYHTAVELFFMAEEHLRPIESIEQGSTPISTSSKASQYLTNIIMIVNDELSQVLISGDNRDLVIQLANTVNQKFSKGNLRFKMKEEDRRHFDTFSMLLRLVSFFNLFRAEKYNEAYDLISNIGIIPFQKERIDTAVYQFNNLDDTIQRKMSDIITASMTILCNLYQQEKTRASGLATTHRLQELRHRANTVLSFAGYIQNYVSSDSYGKLIKLNVAMSS
jgi:nuclear pore complex protein Nup93